MTILLPLIEKDRMNDMLQFQPRLSNYHLSMAIWMSRFVSLLRYLRSLTSCLIVVCNKIVLLNWLRKLIWDFLFFSIVSKFFNILQWKIFLINITNQFGYILNSTPRNNSFLNYLKPSYYFVFLIIERELSLFIPISPSFLFFN